MREWGERRIVAAVAKERQGVRAEQRDDWLADWLGVCKNVVQKDVEF